MTQEEIQQKAYEVYPLDLDRHLIIEGEPYDNNKEKREAYIRGLTDSKPELPSNLDEAAEEYYDDMWDDLGGKAMVINYEHDIWYPSSVIETVFKAGAEWMAGQGWKEITCDNHPESYTKNQIYCVYTREHYLLATVVNDPHDEDLLQWRCTEFPFRRYDMCEGDKYIEIKKK